MRFLIGLASLLLFVNTVRADLDTIGFDGINSQATGLDGTGTVIGMIDVGRPGKPGKDLPIYVNDLVIPTQVYVGSSIDGANSIWVMDAPGDPRGTHSVQVAGVMVATNNGVAPAASLHAGTSNRTMGDVSTGVAANRIARISEMRAINVSVGRDGTPDGSSQLTLFIDWSSKVHNVLYVVAGAEDINEPVYPKITTMELLSVLHRD